jgi:hypothetical protein
MSRPPPHLFRTFTLPLPGQLPVFPASHLTILPILQIVLVVKIFAVGTSTLAGFRKNSTVDRGGNFEHGAQN